MTITSQPGTYFWSNGYAWGTCKVDNQQATLKVLKGNLILKEFSLKGNPKPAKIKLSLKEDEEQTIRALK